MPWWKMVGVLKSRKEEEKNRKPVIGCLIFLLLPLLVPLAISVPGLFGKDFDDEDDISFQLQNSKLYQQIEKTYQEFELEVKCSIAEQITDMREADAKAVAGAMVAMGKKTRTRVVELNDTIASQLSSDLINYALAYTMVKYEDVQDRSERFIFRLKLKSEIRQFYKDITTIKVWREGSFPNVSYCSSVEVMDIRTVSNLYFPKNSEQYLCSYESFQWISETESFPSIGTGNSNIDIEDLKYPEAGMNIPHFTQYDPQWANHPYGNHNMKIAACGPTSMSMILSYLTGRVISPVELADWSMAHGYYVNGQGTSWAFYDGVAKAYGVKSRQIAVSANDIINELKAGRPVITSMKPGTFTKAGHFIVLRGVTSEGKIMVNDPNDSASKNFFNKEFSISLIVDECKGAWAFSN